MSESTEYPISISNAATVPSDNSIPITSMQAIAITMSEKADRTTAKEGTRVLNTTKTTIAISIKAISNARTACFCDS